MSFEIVPQDEAWVKQAKKNLTAFYENQPLDRVPSEFRAYDVSNMFKHKEQPATVPASKSLDEVRREFFDPEIELKPQLERIAKLVRAGFWDDSIQALHPIGAATGWMVDVFGGETVWFTNRPPYPHPAITEAKGIDTLRPNLEKSEFFQAAIKHMRFYRQVVGDRIPIAAPDLQSPVDVASMIFDYTELVYAMMDEPQRVHALMRMITDTIIQACHAFRKEMTDYPMSHFDWWLPRGIWFSDDLQAVLNAELYREFAVPYNEIMAKEFGGVAVHSCGKILHNIENVVSTKGMITFNTHDPLTTLAPMIRNRTAVILGGVDTVMAPNHPECQRPFITDAESLEQFWWEDFEKLSTVEGQRVLYQCHALLCKRTPREAFDRMVTISEAMAKRLSPVKKISI